METSSATLSLSAGEAGDRGVTRLAPPPTVLSPAPSHTMSPPLSDPPCDQPQGPGRPDSGPFTTGAAGPDDWLDSSSSPGGRLRFFGKTGRVLLELTHVPLESPVLGASPVGLTSVSLASSLSPAPVQRSVAGGGRWVFATTANSTFWPPVVSTVTAAVERGSASSGSPPPPRPPSSCSTTTVVSTLLSPVVNASTAASSPTVSNSTVRVHSGVFRRKPDTPVRGSVSPVTCQLLLSLSSPLPPGAVLRRVARAPGHSVSLCSPQRGAGLVLCSRRRCRSRDGPCTPAARAARLAALLEGLLARALPVPASNRKRHTRRCSEDSPVPPVPAPAGSPCKIPATSVTPDARRRPAQQPVRRYKPQQQRRGASKSDRYSIDALLAPSQPKPLFPKHLPLGADRLYPLSPPEGAPLLSPTLGSYWPVGCVSAGAGFEPPRAHVNSVAAVSPGLQSAPLLASPSALTHDLVRYHLSASACDQDSPLNLSKR